MVDDLFQLGNLLMALSGQGAVSCVDKHDDQKYHAPDVTLLAGSARLAPGFRWNLVMQYWAKVLWRPASVLAQTWQGVKQMGTR